MAVLRRHHASRQLMLGVAVAALLAAWPAAAQGILRGMTDEDVITRIGRTAGDQTRNRPPSIRRTEPQARAPALRPARRAGAAPARRPAQQNFRSLERPPNAAVPLPAEGQQVLQGLPPPAQRRPVRRSDDPYAPLGLRLGGFTAFPELSVLGGYDSNPNRAAKGQRRRGSPVVRAEGGFTARSDWSRHELALEARGAYSRFTALPEADRPEASLRLSGRYDISRDAALDGELRARLDTQTPGSPNLTAAAQGRPLTFQYGGSVGATQRFNRLALSLRGSIDRSEFEDARDAAGQTISQKDRQFTQYGLRLRAGYEVTPGMTPFLEVAADARRYDQRIDNQGFRRDSAGLQLRLGTSFEITRTLTGELIAGYGLRRFEDQRLRDLKGPVVEAALTWSVSPLTTLRLRALTEFEETTIPGASGSITRRVSADLSHAFLRNLTLTAGLSYGRADYSGVNRKDDTLRAALGLDYAVSRNFGLRVSYAHERTLSNVAGNNVSANVYLFGARLRF